MTSPNTSKAHFKCTVIDALVAIKSDRAGACYDEMVQSDRKGLEELVDKTPPAQLPKALKRFAASHRCAFTRAVHEKMKEKARVEQQKNKAQSDGKSAS